MRRRVLILRPEPGAANTARKLEALGFSPVCLPLTETRALNAEIPIGQVFDAVTASSANAFRHAAPSLLRMIAELPLFVVGSRTADAAVAAGFREPVVGPGDGESLAAMIARTYAPGSRIAYLCGRVRTSGFEATLRDAGIAVSPIETYDTSLLEYENDVLEDRLGNVAFAAVMIHSRMAAEALLSLTDRSVASRLLLESTLICISERAAEPLRSGPASVRVAATPDEEAMLARLSS